MRTTLPTVLLCMLVLVVSGCVAQPAAPGTDGTGVATSPAPEDRTTAQSTETDSAPDRVESELWGLYTAPNRTEYARSNDLVIENGSVRVVAVLHAGRAPPTAVGDVEVVQEDTAVMMVPIDDLRSLAEHRNVTYLRAPEQPVADSRLVVPEFR